MNFNEFMHILSPTLNNLTLEKRIQFLIKIQKTWIPKIIDSHLKGYLKCENCVKYSKEKTFKHSLEEKLVKREPLYRDAGYGDDDTFGDVIYLFHYKICPKCGYKKVIKKETLEILNEYDRWGNKIK